MMSGQGVARIILDTFFLEKCRPELRIDATMGLRYTWEMLAAISPMADSRSRPV